VLIVDDEPKLLSAYERLLERHGWDVVTAGDGLEARERLAASTFDVIVSDLHMPAHGGLGFLREVRERDLDVPVILMTGAPSVDSSVRAIEYGVFRYLVKPVDGEALLDVVSRAARLHKMARLKRQALELAGAHGKWLGDRAELEIHFERAMDRLWMAYQPIVSWRERRVFGFEALLRSDEPAMRSPGDFLDAAERLGKLRELSRAVRGRVAEQASGAKEPIALFVNLHAADLGDERLLDPRAPLAAIASRVVLEITERASLDGVPHALQHVRTLKSMGFRIAIDDLGAGYAGLTSFTQLEPDIVKLDMSLVRDIDQRPNKRSIVRSMAKLCDELGMQVVAEGIETAAERDVLIDVGCDLLQGYLFARPDRAFAEPRWDSTP
jgi:EAL domain-containing protein (putative c-di-GMP-specific phosphodiesterase class I)/CheY-like chemotaxis protein